MRSGSRYRGESRPPPTVRNGSMIAALSPKINRLVGASIFGLYMIALNRLTNHTHGISLLRKVNIHTQCLAGPAGGKRESSANLERSGRNKRRANLGTEEVSRALSPAAVTKTRRKPSPQGVPCRDGFYAEASIMTRLKFARGTAGCRASLEERIRYRIPPSYPDTDAPALFRETHIRRQCRSWFGRGRSGLCATGSCPAYDRTPGAGWDHTPWPVTPPRM